MKYVAMFLVGTWLLLVPGLTESGARSFDGDPLVAGFSNPSSPGKIQTSIRWGELRVVGHEGEEVRIESRIEVDANLAARMSDDAIRDAVPIRIVERNNSMEVQVDSELDGFYSVDLTIHVPADSSLALEVRNGGNIHVEGVRGGIDISNLNGSVELIDLEGAAVVHCRNGSIRAVFDALVADLPMSFSSLNGSVDVTFPETLSADLKIRYNRGGIESDFEIRSEDSSIATPSTSGLEGRATRLVEGRISHGGPRYYFHTANGTVYLRQAGS